MFADAGELEARERGGGGDRVGEEGGGGGRGGEGRRDIV